MKIWNLIKIVTSIVAITSLIVISIGFYLFDKTQKERCVKIEKIARNEKAVNYLDNWASKYILNKGYYFVTGMNGDIRGLNEGSSVSIEPIPDEKITGIEKYYFRFNVEKISGNFKAEITSDNVGRIEFGRGRDQVIILKNGAKLESYRGYSEFSGRLLRISDTVFAFCADAKFTK